MNVEPRLLLIANKKMRIYSSASIAANSILCLQFNKFSYRYRKGFRKNKERKKTVKPNWLKAIIT